MEYWNTIDHTNVTTPHVPDVQPVEAIQSLPGNSTKPNSTKPEEEKLTFTPPSK